MPAVTVKEGPVSEPTTFKRGFNMHLPTQETSLMSYYLALIFIVKLQPF